MFFCIFWGVGGLGEAFLDFRNARPSNLTKRFSREIRVPTIKPNLFLEKEGRRHAD